MSFEGREAEPRFAAFQAEPGTSHCRLGDQCFGARRSESGGD